MTRRAFLVGDFRSNTGPGIANKTLRKFIGDYAFYSDTHTRMGRFFELILKTPFCKTICFCGFSMLNVYGIKLAKFFGKKTAYLMHGYIELEEKINKIGPDPNRIDAERYIINNVDSLICVSDLLANKIREKYPNIKNLNVIYNVVENDNKNKVEKDPLLIFSTGGGMPRKNNLMVCEAIKNINVGLPKDKQLKYIIAGESYGYEEKFKKYDFVDFVGGISHDESLNLMNKSKLYIQNSLFDTFGLAVIEAISCGCDLVVSKNIGSLDVIQGLSDKSIVYDSNNVREIEDRILANLNNTNKARCRVKWVKLKGNIIAKRFLKILECEYE